VDHHIAIKGVVERQELQRRGGAVATRRVTFGDRFL
jgi:hypothetical protein